MGEGDLGHADTAPEDAAEAAVAMAGGMELTGARETGSTGHETRK